MRIKILGYHLLRHMSVKEGGPLNVFLTKCNATVLSNVFIDDNIRQITGTKNIVKIMAYNLIYLIYHK